LIVKSLHLKDGYINIKLLKILQEKTENLYLIKLLHEKRYFEYAYNLKEGYEWKRNSSTRRRKLKIYK
jgi:hypothetical protein